MAVQEIFDAVLAFDQNRAADLVREELQKQTDLQLILNEGLVRAMEA